MQVLAKTEYQDLYRVADGVLLVVNKFKPIDYGENKWISLFNPNVKSYKKGCQKQLKILKEDYYNSFLQATIRKGTVLYCGRPVELVDKCEWDYQIKTTGESFSGNSNYILKLINDISEIIRTGNLNRE